MAFNRLGFSKNVSGFIKNANTRFLKRAMMFIFSPNSRVCRCPAYHSHRELKEIGLFGYFWV
jgi:hypothetical protein